MNKRQQLLALIAELSAVNPEYRLGQMLMNMIMLQNPPEAEAIWNAEDDTLIEAARELLRIQSQRQRAVA